MTNAKKSQKLSISDYKALREKQAKRRFKIEFYPWPVLLALGIPFGVLIFLIIYLNLFYCFFYHFFKFSLGFLVQLNFR